MKPKISGDLEHGEHEGNAVRAAESSFATRHKPATPLPWVAEVDYATNTKKRRVLNSAMVVAEKGGMPGILVSQGGVVEKRDRENAEYIAHACNAYPKMVAMLRSCAGRLVGIEAFLRELGEEA